MRIDTFLKVKIEKAINQKRPFRSEQQKALVNLIYTHNWVAGQVKSLMKPFGITPQQYNVLRILKGAGKPISTSLIRERLLYKMADTSRMVDRLSDKGLVVRKVCPSDKRLVDIKLSDMGEKLLNQMTVLDQQLDEVMGSLSQEEAIQLNLLMDKVRQKESE